MRVVFLTHNYPRHPDDLAGAFLATLAGALARRGLDVRVIAPSERGGAGEESRDGVHLRRVRYASPLRETIAYGAMGSALARPSGWRALAGLWRALRRAAKAELDAGADLVHAHWWLPAGLAAPKGAPLVLTSHGTDAALLRRSRVARRLAQPVYRRARVVTTVSRELASWIQEGAGRYVDRSHIQPMPVEASRFRWTAGGGGAIIVARLTRQKRVDLALRAWGTIVAGRPRLRLTVLGDGPERGSLERLASQLGLADSVRFLGAVPPERVPDYLATADVMLFPAHGEGFGLAAAEALMAGVPVVACWDGGGVLDVVPESGAGRLTLPAPDPFADAVLDLMGDPDRLEMGRVVGEAWRARLDPDRVAEVCEGWYREALGA